MPTWIRTGARIALTAAAVLTLSRTASGPAAADPLAVRGTNAQGALVDWAMARYERAGLQLPPVQVVFHPDPAGCGGNSGFFASGHLDVCVTELSAYARNVVVHELAHAWCDANLTDRDREGFLHLRGLTTWNSWDQPWAYRGYEQAAEIITWGVGDRAIPPLLEEDDDPEQLLAAYETLVGSPPRGRVG